MFWLVGSWKRCSIGWFLEEVCYFLFVWLVVVEGGEEIQCKWLVVKGWLDSWLVNEEIGWFQQWVGGWLLLELRMCRIGCWRRFVSFLVGCMVSLSAGWSREVVDCCWGCWGGAAVVAGQRLIGYFVAKRGCSAQRVPEADPIPDTPTRGALIGWCLICQLVCCWKRWGGAAVVVSQRLIGYFVAKRGYYLIVLLSIGCLVGCCWKGVEEVQQ